MNPVTGFRLIGAVVRFLETHPNDGFGGPSTSVIALRDSANLKECSLDDLEDELKRLHATGAIYLQRWIEGVGFMPWQAEDARFFDGMFRILSRADEATISDLDGDVNRKVASSIPAW
jgi:hypothetical protein